MGHFLDSPSVSVVSVFDCSDIFTGEGGECFWKQTPLRQPLTRCSIFTFGSEVSVALQSDKVPKLSSR